MRSQPELLMQIETPIEARRKILKQGLTQLSNDWGKVNNQINETIDESNRSRLQVKADRIYKEMEEVDQKLKQLDASNSTRNLFYLKFQQDLSKIDFDKAMDQIDKMIRKFRAGVKRDALLIVQDSLSMAGELCITEIKQRLCRETGDFNHIKFEFSHGGRLDKIGLLEGLLGYLGITSTQDIQQYEAEYIDKIIEKICESLKGGSIIFLEIRKWDVLSCQEEVLLWFVTQFWTLLITKLDVIAQTHRQVKFISVIVANAKFPSKCLNSLEFKSQKNNLNILKLSLRKWNIDDIQRWLESYPGLKNPHSIELAKYIHRSSKGGIPAMVCNALSEELLNKG